MHYHRHVRSAIFQSHWHEITNLYIIIHEINQKRPLFYSVMCMSKTIAFRKRYELKIGHFGEIQLTDEVFSSYGPTTLLKLVYYYWILIESVNE